MMKFVSKLGTAATDRFWRAPRGMGKPIDSAAWNADYATGKWDYLRGDAERARFVVIANYISTFRPNASVLDIGCGEGILRGHFRGDEISSYVGIDLSEVAIHKAAGRGFGSSEFRIADLDEYQFGTSYDAIVFNEVIYYAPDPALTLRRYLGALNGDGLLIVSMVDYNRRMRAIWRRLNSVATADLTTRIDNRRGQVWDIAVYRAT